MRRNNLCRLISFTFAAWAIIASYSVSAGSEARKKAVLEDDARIKIQVGAAIVTAEVAKSNMKRHIGLGGREKLNAEEGMFFVFAKPGRHSIVNTGMQFKIDIIWIKGNAVVDMSVNMPDFKTLPNYIVTPRVDADFVLETNAGFIAAHGIRIGTPVHWRE